MKGNSPQEPKSQATDKEDVNSDSDSVHMKEKSKTKGRTPDGTGA